MSSVRLRPERPNHVWSYDFVSARTHDGRTVRMLNLIDERGWQCLMVRPERRWSSAKVEEPDYPEELITMRATAQRQPADTIFGSFHVWVQSDVN